MMFARVRTSLGLAAVLLMVGCGGPAGPERVDVEGTLSFDGVPVKNGAIELIAVAGPPQPIMVRDGKFTSLGQYGVICGEYQLIFHSYELVMPPDSELGEMGGELIPERMSRIELLPAKYSTEECTEKLSLKPGTGSVTLTYDLKS